MSSFLEIFERREKKYLLSVKDCEKLLGLAGGRLQHGEFFDTDVCSLYYDTSESTLINRSLESPVYKEKLRVRSYGVPISNSLVFIELKKKFKGVVYKRRVGCSLTAARAYLMGASYADAVRRYPLQDEQLQQHALSPASLQTVREIDFMRQRYGVLSPAMLICSRRLSFVSDDVEAPLRVTFDQDILWRDTDLDLQDGIGGNRIISADELLMEVKCAGAYPLWFTHLLDGLDAYPESFSKYGNAYRIQQGALSAPAAARDHRYATAPTIYRQGAAPQHVGVGVEKGIHCA